VKLGGIYKWISSNKASLRAGERLFPNSNFYPIPPPPPSSPSPSPSRFRAFVSVAVSDGFYLLRRIVANATARMRAQYVK